MAEVNAQTTSHKILFNWIDGYSYYAMRVLPPDLVLTDFEKTEIIINKKHVVIDLLTMRVLDNNCGITPEEAETCLLKYM